MGEWRLFEEGTIPDYTTPDFYAGRESAPHLEQDLHKGRLHLTAEHVKAAASVYDLSTLVDLGCGDGGFLSLVPELTAWGYDLQESNVRASKSRGVDVRYGNILEDELEWGEIAVATECCEHLVDPHQFVRDVATRSKVLVASSPWTETEEAHYGYHSWCWDQEGYRALIEQGGFTVIRHETVDMFQVITGVRAE